ncbi:hypothetical protein Bca52824_041290 [Brassica carinata]|uniref:Jacalin-type lectin domain-containing protein n=1 Tax=Brassica carinata TaxID=52824 RepID=A0A8X7UZW2_BRACI|nr:hypothetical protein Bca52824_041290 [Brassica carinata]
MGWWCTGAYDGVKRVYVGQAQDGISVVKFVYDKGTEDIVGAEHGTSTLLGFEELELEYPSEYITAVQGTYDKIFGSDATVINMLRFKTNKQTSTPFGLEAGTAFELKEEGHKIVGFHGKVSDLLHQLGVYVLPMAQKVEAHGGKGGNQWDDGSEHDAVIKIQVGAGGIGIQYVKFDYVKNGQTEEAPLRGIKGRSIAADPFVISHPGEHLVSVEGWYNPEGLHQGLKFKSNKKTSDLIGYDDGTHFTLQVQDKKIVGFHGFAGDYVHSLGAYFSPLTSSTTLTPAKKLPALGQGHDGVSAVKFEYVNGSQVVIGGERGKPTLLGFEESKDLIAQES